MTGNYNSQGIDPIQQQSELTPTIQVIPQQVSQNNKQYQPQGTKVPEILEEKSDINFNEPIIVKKQ